MATLLHHFNFSKAIDPTTGKEITPDIFAFSDVSRSLVSVGELRADVRYAARASTREPCRSRRRSSLASDRAVSLASSESRRRPSRDFVRFVASFSRLSIDVLLRSQRRTSETMSVVACTGNARVGEQPIDRTSASADAEPRPLETTGMRARRSAARGRTCRIPSRSSRRSRSLAVGPTVLQRLATLFAAASSRRFVRSSSRSASTMS